MQTHSLFLSQKSLKIIKQHDDFISKCSSNEDYHGGVSVTVPFYWEREPGTPKVKSSGIHTLPPLTPPPSYFYSTSSTKRSVEKQNHSKSKLLDTIVPKRYRRKTPRVQLCPGSSSSSSSSGSSYSSGSSSPRPKSYSVPSSPVRALKLDVQDELSRGGLFCDLRADVKELREYRPCIVSSPCFGRGAGTTRPSGFCSTLLKVLRRHE